VVFSSGTESLFSYLFVYICIVVGDPMIMEEVWYSINRFKPATFVCPSQARSWISNATLFNFFF